MSLRQFLEERSAHQSSNYGAMVLTIFLLIAGWTSSISYAQERPTASTDEQLPGFASLSGQRAAVSIDPTLTAEDLAAIIEADPRATQCSDALIRAQWQQGFANRLLAAAHFDNCQIDASLQYLHTEYERADRAASTGDVFTALRHLGHVLNSVITFYAHTNFVELASERWQRHTEVPIFVLWDRSSDTALKEFRPHLVSGRFFGETLLDSNLCREGTPTHRAMNKDSPTSERGSSLIPAWGMTHYRATVDLTKASSLKLLRDTMRRPSWSAVVKQCGATYGFALRADVRKE